MAARAGLAFEPLLEGLSARANHEQPDASVPWAEFVTFWERFAAGLPDEARLASLTDETVAALPADQLRQEVAGVCTDAASVYELLARWAGPAAFHCVRFEAEARVDGTLRLCVAIHDGQAGNRPWLVSLEGCLARLSELCGFAPSTVSRIALSARGAEWHIVPGAGRRASLPTPPPALVQQLYRQQDELTRTFDALRTSERDFRTTLDALPVAVAVHEHGRLQYVNQSFATLLGRAADELRGHELAALFPESEHARLLPLMDTSPSGWARLDLDTPDGRRHLRARGAGVLVFGGRVRRLFVAGDVTHEEATQRRAERNEVALSAVLSALPDIVMHFDAQGRLSAVHGGRQLEETASMLKHLGRTMLEIQVALGRDHLPAAKVIRSLIEQTLADQQERSHAYISYASDGRPRDFFARVLPLGDEVLYITHDRTQQVEDQRRLMLAERMASLGELAAGVAHELNNPLTSVLGNLAVLQRQLVLARVPPELLHVVDELETDCRRIRETALRMREFSDVQAPQRQVVDLRQLLERADRMTRTELRYRAQLALDVAPGLTVWGDPRELEEVFVNLLTNTAQAMPESASPETHHVRVTARADGASAVVEVDDDGVGIAPDVLPRIFDPFFTTRTRRVGTGLGLAISHRIVTAHGGTIHAASGEGRTTLTVRLPLAERRPSLLETISLEPRAARRARVLVIDDEPSIGRTIQRTLFQHDVQVLNDGRSAFTRLRDGELPDLVLCDLMMPGCTGMELWAALRASRPETLLRVAFMSGGTFTPMASEFIQAHQVKVLAKPFRDGQLDSLLERVLETGSLEGLATV